VTIRKSLPRVQSTFFKPSTNAVSCRLHRHRAVRIVHGQDHRHAAVEVILEGYGFGRSRPRSPSASVRETPGAPSRRPRPAAAAADLSTHLLRLRHQHQRAPLAHQQQRGDQRRQDRGGGLPNNALAISVGAALGLRLPGKRPWDSGRLGACRAPREWPHFTDFLGSSGFFALPAAGFALGSGLAAVVGALLSAAWGGVALFGSRPSSATTSCLALSMGVARPALCRDRRRRASH